MTKEEYLRKVAEMQTDISAIKQEGREKSKTCNACIHKAVCYRYSYGLPENYADKCGDFQTQKSGKCKNCKYFEYDSVAKVDGIPLIVAHEICNKWGDGCKTSEEGYCYLFEPQESEDKG